jgi:predicted nucleotide-binding protein
MAKLGRHRVVILYKGSTEIPSDLLGVVYLGFQTSIFEVSEKTRQRLSGAGLLP